MLRSLRLPVAVVATLVVAEAAIFLFRPRDLGPNPVPVSPQTYFTAAQLEKADDFRSGQRIIFVLRITLELGLLVAIVRRPPARVAARLERMKQPVVAGAAAAALLSLTLGLAPMPLRVVALERARDVGLVTQSIPEWLGDVAKGEAIAALFAAAGGALLIVTVRKLKGRWWIAGTGIVMVFAVATTMLSPVLLEPVFNKFKRLPEGQLRSQVLDLARASGVKVGEVYSMDASRRTTAANAYVSGLGATKRVVLYDTLLSKAERGPTLSVVAHELGHVKYRDVRNGLLYLAIVAPFGMATVALLSERFGLRSDDVSPARAVPAVALTLAIVVPVLTAVSNQLSRDVERRADLHALQVTDDPDALIALQRQLSVQNVSEPDPPDIFRVLFGTHPTTLERIGFAEAWKRRNAARVP